MLVLSTGEYMYKKALIAFMVAMSLLGSQAYTAVAESDFAVGDKWAFGIEIDLMEELQSDIDELEGNITELMESEEAEMVKNASGLELKSFALKNEAILGFYYTGEVVDDFDQMVHMRTQQSFYSHTVLGTTFTTMLPGEGEHNLVLKVSCDGEYDEENDECGEDDEDAKIELLDNNTGEPLVLEEVSTALGGSMHYVAKITQDTWWTEDTHELARTELTLELGAAGAITIKNVPNITRNGVSILEGDEGEEAEFECANGYETYPFYYANDGWEDCDDGSDEPGNGYDFECDNGDTYPMDFVNDGEWDCENGEDEGESGEGGSDPFSVCDENEEEKVYSCYETIDHKLETAVFEMAADISLHLAFDFGDKPMNAMDLPLEENKYWEGELDRITISGDLGGKIDVKKPELSICPDNDCDQLPEMEELYSGLTEAIDELHNNESFSVTVDRDNDGLPDVITQWDDLFPMYVPETWMDQIFQEILEEISCEDDESAQEGEECDETAEEEFEKLNLRIENNRFAFGPYKLHQIEDYQPLPYAFETGEKETATASDGTEYEGYQVFPTDRCSENNPNRDDDDCNQEDEEGDREDDDDDGSDEGIIPGGSRSGHDGDHEDDCHSEEEEGDIFCGSEVIWFHNAETGHPAYINMDMPNLREDGYTVEMMPIESSVAEAKLDANADAENPEKTTLIEFDADDLDNIDEESALPGFGIMAAGASLLFVSRRFRS